MVLGINTRLRNKTTYKETDLEVSKFNIVTRIRTEAGSGNPRDMEVIGPTQL